MDHGQEGSVTRWIGHLKGGDPHAASHLWQRYFHRIVALARTRFGHAPRAVADEEDAALSAFRNLCEGAAQGRFDQLHDRDDLWRLLAIITARKAADLRKQQGRLKRGGGKVLRATELGVGGLSGSPSQGFEQLASGDPTPEFAAIMAEEFHRRLGALDDELRQVALLRLEGHSNDEIADRLGCARRTVARRLEQIRDAWAGAAGNGDSA
jgi:DNA-directed RNA polymerase specialized sigma24 family protein